MPWYIWVILIFVVLVYIGYANDKAKRKRLLDKYKDPELVEKLMKGMFWQGQDSEQLKDSLGKPIDISYQVFKTKNKETWKYQKTGNNRYNLKIHLEDGVVIGWDKK